MAADSVQQSNLAWQLRHLGKNVSEWIQLQLSRGDPEPQAPPPEFTLPDWLGRFFLGMIIAIAVIWLAWLLVQLVERYLAGRAEQSQRQPVIQTIRDTEPDTVAAWLQRARQAEQDGNWREACRSLYMAALQLLDDREWIPHQISRTDGEYLQESQRLKQPRPLQLLVRTHERSLFGGVSLTAENLQHCRRAYEELAKR